MSLRGTRFDIALAAALTLTTQAELVLVDGVEGSMALQHACFAVMTAALAVRRTNALACVVAVAAALSVQTVLAGEAPVVGGLIAAVIATYSAAAYACGWHLIAGAAAVVVGIVGSGLAHEESRTVGDFAGNLIIFGVFFALGLVLSRRRADNTALASDLAAERRRAGEILVEERARIARELHDVIAHHVSAMTLQAGGAQQVLKRDPDRVREPLEVIEEHGRRAMDEMRRLLGILREDRAVADADGHSQPSLRGLDDLAAHVDLDVDVEVRGESVALPAGVDLAAYRIIQEALTNAVKHSCERCARVAVTYAPAHLEVEVFSPGPPVPGPGGHGLVGMRERAAIYGGTLSAGAAPEGGFRVHASIPLERS